MQWKAIATSGSEMATNSLARASSQREISTISLAMTIVLMATRIQSLARIILSRATSTKYRAVAISSSKET